MKIATWNINGLNKRLEVVLGWLSVAQPDVVALQETKTVDADFPHAALADVGYSALAVGQRSWNGVALLAREAEIIPVRLALPGDADDRQARYVEAAIDGVLFASLYVPNGNPQPGPKFDYKLAWFERLLAHAATLIASGHPVALIGDFNVVPAARDVYATRSYDDNALLQPETRAAWERLLAQGWLDALRTKHPDEAIYTFWDYLRNRWPRNAGLRIDHLLLSPSLAKRLRRAEVDRDWRGVEGASDHAPVWIDLK
jgi:exodeoxyribonuclease-3